MIENYDKCLPAKQKRPGGRSAQVISSIHEATVSLLEEKGYSDVEIPEIAERAGVNKTSIYRRWATKEDLVVDVALRRTAEIIPIPNTGNLEGDLREFLLTISASLESKFFNGLLLALINSTSTETHEARSRYWEERFKISGKIVLAAIERNELPEDTPPNKFLEAAASTIFFRKLILGECITTEEIYLIAERTIVSFQKFK